MLSFLKNGKTVVQATCIALSALVVSAAQVEAQTHVNPSGHIQDGTAAHEDDELASAISSLIERQTQMAESLAGSPLDTALVPLPADQAELTFEGEYSVREWPMAVSASMAGAPSEFVVGLESAVSVMPEVSTLTIEINDRLVGTLALGGRHDGMPHVVSIPAGLLAPGINSVRLALHQRHRVDCSLNATYELWTRIDPERTGLKFQAASTSITSLDDLYTVHRAPGGDLPIRLVLPNGAGEDLVEAGFDMAQRLALAAYARNPVVEISSQSQAATGIEVLLGAPGQIASAIGEEGGAIHTPLGMTVRPGARPGSAQVLMAFANREGLAKQITAFDRWLAERSYQATPEGARALRLVRGTDVKSDKTYSFGELGAHSAEFSGRLSRHQFRINLPSDFFSAGYGDLMFRLDGAYAPGLDVLNSIAVRINDVEAASVRLAKGTSGALFENRQIQVPLSAFRPGVNRIEVQTQLASEDDHDCDIDVLLNTDSRFVLMETSTLHIPSIARLGRLPDLGSTANDGYPYNLSGEAATVFVPRPDANSIRAAATYVARLAVAKGSPLHYDLALRPVDKEAGSAIIVAAVDDLPTSVFAPAKLDRAFVQRQLVRLPAPGAPLVAASARQRLAQAPSTQTAFPSLVSVRPARGLEAVDDTDLRSRWQDKVSDKDNQWTGIFSDVRSLLENNIGLTVDELGLPIGRSTEFDLKPNADLFIFQAEAAEVSARTWTILTAADPQALATSVARLGQPSIWTEVTGRGVALYPDGELVISKAGGNEQFYKFGSPLNLSNARLILAGWFSGNVLIYAALLLATCMCVGFFTDRMVKRVGVTDD